MYYYIDTSDPAGDTVIIRSTPDKRRRYVVDKGWAFSLITSAIALDADAAAVLEELVGRHNSMSDTATDKLVVLQTSGFWYTVPK